MTSASPPQAMNISAFCLLAGYDPYPPTIISMSCGWRNRTMLRLFTQSRLFSSECRNRRRTFSIYLSDFAPRFLQKGRKLPLCLLSGASLAGSSAEVPLLPFLLAQVILDCSPQTSLDELCTAGISSRLSFFLAVI